MNALCTDREGHVHCMNVQCTHREGHVHRGAHGVGDGGGGDGRRGTRKAARGDDDELVENKKREEGNDVARDKKCACGRGAKTENERKS